MQQFPTENFLCSCGHESPSTSKFCNACGNPISHAPTSQPTYPPASQASDSRSSQSRPSRPPIGDPPEDDQYDQPPVAQKSKAGSPFVFWRRLFAFWIDGLILGAFGFGLGLCFYNAFAQMGPYGRLIGFCIALLYFGLFNSNLGRGQTIGERITKIKVVDAQGEWISLAKSLLRTAILWLPISLNNLSLPISVMFTQPVLSALLVSIVFGLGGAICYLFLFNRKTRQSAHDLLVGSYVVRSDTVDIPAPTPIWKGHLIIISSLAAIIVVASVVAVPMLSKQTMFAGMIELAQAIENSGDVFSTQITQSTSFGGTFGSTMQSKTSLIVVDVCKHDPKQDMEVLGKKMVTLVLKNYPQVMKLDGLQLQLSYGFDIGIASGWQRESRYFTQAELAKLTGAAAPDTVPATDQELRPSAEERSTPVRKERSAGHNRRAHSRMQVERQ